MEDVQRIKSCTDPISFFRYRSTHLRWTIGIYDFKRMRLLSGLRALRIPSQCLFNPFELCYYSLSRPNEWLLNRNRPQQIIFNGEKLEKKRERSRYSHLFYISQNINGTKCKRLCTWGIL